MLRYCAYMPFLGIASCVSRDSLRERRVVRPRLVHAARQSKVADAQVAVTASRAQEEATTRRGR
jgi:hypothetical protein